jgi:hypothetical protein
MYGSAVEGCMKLQCMIGKIYTRDCSIVTCPSFSLNIESSVVDLENGYCTVSFGHMIPRFVRSHDEINSGLIWRTYCGTLVGPAWGPSIWIYQDD